MMCKIEKYPQDMIQCIRSSFCIANFCIIYPFLKRISMVKCNYAGTVDISCGILSNVILFSPSLVLRESDTDSENISLILLTVSDGQKTCSLKVYHVRSRFLLTVICCPIYYWLEVSHEVDISRA